MSKVVLKSITPNIMVEDVNQSVQFYSDILGFHLIAAVPGEGAHDWAMVSRDKISFMFQKKANLLHEYPQLMQTTIGGALTLFIVVEDVVSLYHEVIGKVKVVKELSKTFYGMQEFAIKDCNGFIVTFAE